tara:strand:+ start:1771 stop:2616 length:846 start_codon:yes stop_codon:yes gene_type:complete
MIRKNKLRIYIDGDIILHKEASAAETPIDWGEDWWGLYADLKYAKSEVEVAIDGYEQFAMDRYLEYKNLSPDEAPEIERILVLSDKGNNWRRFVMPSYKHNRANRRKPILLNPLREWLIQDWGAIWWWGLEADDVIGMLASRNSIIISDDKDFETVPCLLYKPSTDKITKITKMSSQMSHLYQTLTGDVADGYGGCPGIGPINAKRILKHGTWMEVIGAYRKAGLEEDDALIQARVAHILTSRTEYRRKPCRVRLWYPSQYGRFRGLHYDKTLSNQYVKVA